MIRIPLELNYPSLGIAPASEAVVVSEPSRREPSLTENQTTPENPGLDVQQNRGRCFHPNDGGSAMIRNPLELYCPSLGIATATVALVEDPDLNQQQKRIVRMLNCTRLKFLFFDTVEGRDVVHVGYGAQVGQVRLSQNRNRIRADNENFNRFYRIYKQLKKAQMELNGNYNNLENDDE